MTRTNRTTSPLVKTIEDFMTLLKVVMFLVFVGYCLSGLTLIKPDEIGMILRMGKLNGKTPVDQILNPGWVLALPQPFDEVLKIPVKQILQVRISELAAISKAEAADYRSIDPLQEGYCISGDENIFQASILVKYQISEPTKAIFKLSDSFSTFNRMIHDLTIAENKLIGFNDCLMKSSFRTLLRRYFELLFRLLIIPQILVRQNRM